MINNDPSKSIRSIARDMETSEFLIKQLYFSFEMRKGQFLSQSMKDKRKDQGAKLLNKLKQPLQPNWFLFFSDKKDFCQDQMVNSENNCCLVLSSQDVLKVLKTK